MEKIKILKIKDKYKVIISKYNKCNIEFNGKIFENVDEFFTDEVPISIFIFHPATVVNEYINIKTNEKISDVLYNSKLEELKINSYLNEDSELVFYEDIDDFNYKCFIKYWNPIVNNIISKIKMEFIIIDVFGNFDNPYIIPLRYCGNSDFVNDSECLYEYKPDVYKIAQHISNSLGFIEKPYNKETDEYTVQFHKSNNIFEFIKVNDKYMDQHFSKNYPGISIGTFEECNTKYQEHYDKIYNSFVKCKNLIDMENQKFSNLQVYNDLNYLKDKLNSDEIKLKEIRTFTLKKINELIEKIEKSQFSNI